MLSEPESDSIVVDEEYAVGDSASGYGGKHNRLNVDYNFGWFISQFKSNNGDTHRGLFGQGYSFGYQHVFKRGHGFGVNFVKENGPDCISTYFLGRIVC